MEGIREFIRMKRVPKNLEECFLILEQVLDEETIKQFKAMEEKDMMATTHHSLGRWFRNNYGLWNNKSVLCIWFKEEFGIVHADDISGIILTSFHRKLNAKEINVEEQVQYYKNWWEGRGRVTLVESD